MAKLFIDRGIWIKMINKHKKYMKYIHIHIHIHTWISPQAGQVRASLGIRVPHSIQYFVEEPLAMPTDFIGIIFQA